MATLPVFHPPADSLGSRSLLAYAALNFPLAFAALPLYVHVPNLYAAFGTLSFVTLGTILWVSRLTDALVDPWLGQLSDRLGRPRLLIVIAMTLLSTGLCCLLNPPESWASHKTLSSLLITLWLTATLSLTYLGFSLATINYLAWGASLGNNAADRLRVTSIRELLGLTGVITAAILPSLLVASQMANDNAQALGMMGWLFILISGFCVFTTCQTAPAPRLSFTDSPNSHLIGLVQAWGCLRQDKTFLNLLAVLLLSGLSAAIPATLVLFYIADLLQMQQWQGVFLALYFLTAGLSLPVWNWFAGRYSKTTAWSLSMGLAIVSFVWAFFLYPGAALPFALICLFTGAALGAELAIPSALLADHLQRQNQQTSPLSGAGVYFGLWQFVNKLALALAAGVALPLLAYLGYQVGAAETVSLEVTTASTGIVSPDPSHTTGMGLTALAAVYALLPAAIKCLALFWLWRHKAHFEGNINAKL